MMNRHEGERERERAADGLAFKEDCVLSEKTRHFEVILGGFPACALITRS